MKNIALFALMALTFTTGSLSTALGADAPNSAEVDRASELPTVISPEIEVDPPGGLAAVQPAAFITFAYPSCAAMPFYADVKTRHSNLLVALKIRENARDCRGSKKIRRYRRQISSDFHHEVTLLNPIQY